MKCEVNCQIGALFKLVAHKGDPESPTQETGWFNNLVLNAGLDRMSVGTWIDRCCVGTGNSTPVASQTALDNFIASTTTRQSTTGARNTTTEPYYYSLIVTWRFGQGVAAGNISEVGMGWANSNLWNRALIKDVGGNPTTITVLSDEYLDVVAEVRVYMPSTASGAFELRDKNNALISTHTYTGKPYMFGTPNSLLAGQVVLGGGSVPMDIYTGALGANITSPPTGTSGGASSYTVTHPTARSVRTVAIYDLTKVNMVHQSFAAYFNNLLTANAYQFQISPTITKNSAQEFRYTFEMSWDRYTP